METKDIYVFLKPSLEKFSVAEKKELCNLITGQDLKTPEATTIGLPTELTEEQLSSLEALFEDLVKYGRAETVF